MEERFRIRGHGTVEFPAAGISDAEHRVVREIAARWPEARVAVLGVERRGEGDAIVEEFRVSYRVEAEIAAGAGARGPGPAVWAEARRRLSGSRYERTVWERPPAPGG